MKSVFRCLRLAATLFVISSSPLKANMPKHTLQLSITNLSDSDVEELSQSVQALENEIGSLTSNIGRAFFFPFLLPVKRELFRTFILVAFDNRQLFNFDLIEDLEYKQLLKKQFQYLTVTTDSEHRKSAAFTWRVGRRNIINGRRTIFIDSFIPVLDYSNLKEGRPEAMFVESKELYNQLIAAIISQYGYTKINFSIKIPDIQWVSEKNPTPEGKLKTLDHVANVIRKKMKSKIKGERLYLKFPEDGESLSDFEGEFGS